MYRLSLASCLFAAALALPATATAQDSCQIVAVDSVGAVLDKPGGTVIRRELRGRADLPVEVRCGDVLLIAQEIQHLIAEDRLIARGNVVFQQVGTRIVADRGEFDRKTRLGFFEAASGT